MTRAELHAALALSVALAACTSGGGLDLDAGPIEHHAGPCDEGLERCDGFCVSLAVDALNCGACGNACGGGLICEDRECIIPCSAGFHDCDGRCLDIATSTANCGRCGRACGRGNFCLDGECVCNDGSVACNGICCGPNQTCEDGLCGCGPEGDLCDADRQCVLESCCQLREYCDGGTGPDNDCDGFLEDGCPSDVVLGTEAMIGGSCGTLSAQVTSSSAVCPSGLPVGVSIAGQTSLVCAEPRLEAVGADSIDGSNLTADDYDFDVTWDEVSVSTSPTTSLCPAGTWLVGLDMFCTSNGRQGVMPNCQPLRATRQTNATYEPEVLERAFGASVGSVIGTRVSLACPEGSVVASVSTQSGSPSSATRTRISCAPLLLQSLPFQ